ncbi:MAG: DEAD/DEAH box helicase [Candidatus ainarchaeum sp.]|nr:DEAD/DEAH box helicase [Candidatus ainarchaeum sp.]
MQFEPVPETEKIVLSANKFENFNPMQAKIVSERLFSKSLVVSSPTASGKTVIAELAALYSILEKKQKVVYTCPLRALASEHFEDFKKKYSHLRIRFALSTGDLDSSSAYLANYDCIFTTYEKLNSLVRHNAPWLQGIGLLVVDEIHEIDSDRGPTIEVTVAELRQISTFLRVLGLSATIPNAKEISEWLSAELVESDYRPVPLKEGAFFGGKIFYSGAEENIPEENFGNTGSGPLLSIVKDSIVSRKKQALVFANTRKSAESAANSLANFVGKTLSEKEKDSLSNFSGKILNALEIPTEQCRKLSSLVEKGVAFHHAGLLQKQRSLVEAAFRENKIKVVCATPTLAAGVNTPSHTVIIPSLFRYGSAGMERISVRDYKQMSGRAGRPKFDSEGRSIVFARSDSDKDDVLENFVNGEIEPVNSRLGIEPVLRMHLLSLAANSFIFDLKSMESFFSKTFYAKQFGNLHALLGKTTVLIEQLREMGFLEGSESEFRATKLGVRVSELYLDPMSAFAIVHGLKSKRRFSDFFYLYLLSSTYEFFPWQSVSRKKEPELWEQISSREGELPIDLAREQFFDSSLLPKFYSALLLEAWVNEKPEQLLLEEFNVQPGILHSKLNICDWLAYSAFELAKLIGAENHFVPISKIRRRLKHGIKEELIGLCEVRGIGRVRARRLWRSNVRSVSELKKVDLKDLQRILGEKVAEKIKEAIGQ